MDKVIVKTARSADFQKKFQPPYNPEDEYRPLKFSHYEPPIPGYAIARNGVVTGPVKKGLNWCAANAKMGEKSRPQLVLRGKHVLLHRAVGLSFFEELKWHFSDEFMREFNNAGPILTRMCIDEMFQIDHIDGEPWNPHISNLRFMSPRDNIAAAHDQVLLGVAKKYETGNHANPVFEEPEE